MYLQGYSFYIQVISIISARILPGYFTLLLLSLQLSLWFSHSFMFMSQAVTFISTPTHLYIYASSVIDNSHFSDHHTHSPSICKLLHYSLHRFALSSTACYYNYCMHFLLLLHTILLTTASTSFTYCTLFTYLLHALPITIVCTSYHNFTPFTIFCIHFSLQLQALHLLLQATTLTITS